MCGIAGLYSIEGRVKPEWIKMMTEALKHRGPDDEGFLGIGPRGKELFHLVGSDSQVDGIRIERFDQPVGLFLGHRRLSILDLSPSGHQPMSSQDKTLWIVHNGEVYNYLELREELKSLGCCFETNTDTEVLLAAYEHWGEDCLQRFNGMWSFVIYDGRRNILFGSRDRFGVKPLYYWLDSGYFAFASEIKALVKLPFIKKEINPEAVFDYLIFNWQDHEEEGFFRRIWELKPAFAFRYDLSTNRFEKWKYYTLRFFDRWEKFDEKKSTEYVSRVRELSFDAVALRLCSDVPVGSCWSGGIDSSAVVCIINRLLEGKNIKQVGDRQRLFTASYDKEAVDERKWAKLVVEQTLTSWHQTFPKASELLEDLEDLVYSQDVPFGSTSMYVQYRVMKLAKENGIKVLLDGQGGDELFSGYPAYYRAFFAEMIRNFALGQLAGELKNLKNAPINRVFLLTSLMRLAGAKFLPSLLKETAVKATTGESAYLSADFWSEQRNRIEAVKERAITSLNEMLYQFMTGLHLKMLLRYGDRNSMRFSIESRTPFADDINLIEYLFEIPSVYKIHNGWSKHLLREAMKDVLPEEIRLRKDKIGFASPEYDWLNEISDSLRSFITDDLNQFLDVRKIQKDWSLLLRNQPREGTTNIWRLINFAVWKKVYQL